MKQAHLFTVIILLVSCKHEKMVTSTENSKTLFNTNQPASPDNGTTRSSFYSAGSNARAGQAVIKELMEKEIPLGVPSYQCDSWEEYAAIVEGKKDALSENAMAFCAQTLLGAFKLYELPYSRRLSSVIRENLQIVVAHQYKGYKVLYETLTWIKTNESDSFAIRMKQAILAYARPLMPQPDPKLKNSAFVDANPQLKEELRSYAEKIKENDSYIEKIRTL